jgi:hypothetical protein
MEDYVSAKLVQKEELHIVELILVPTIFLIHGHTTMKTRQSYPTHGKNIFPKLYDETTDDKSTISLSHLT